MASNDWSRRPLPQSQGTVIQDPVSDIIVSQRISAWLGRFRFPSWLTVPGTLIEKLDAEVLKQKSTEPGRGSLGGSCSPTSQK